MIQLAGWFLFLLSSEVLELIEQGEFIKAEQKMKSISKIISNMKSVYKVAAAKEQKEKQAAARDKEEQKRKKKTLKTNENRKMVSALNTFDYDDANEDEYIINVTS